MRTGDFGKFDYTDHIIKKGGTMKSSGPSEPSETAYESQKSLFALCSLNFLETGMGFRV